MVVYSRANNFILYNFKNYTISPFKVSSLMQVLQVYCSHVCVCVCVCKRWLCFVLGLVQNQVEFQCMKSFKILP